MGTLTWVDPTQRADGTMIAPDTIVIKVYDSASPTPNTPIGQVAGGVQTYNTGPLSPGPHTWIVTATDSEGDVSVSSNPASYTAVIAAPNPPTNLAFAP